MPLLEHVEKVQVETFFQDRLSLVHLYDNGKHSLKKLSRLETRVFVLN